MSTSVAAPSGPPRLIVVLGPTAAGKSAVAESVARACRQRQPPYHQRRYVPHIINCDVMQIYTGLPIATNKPSAAELQAAQHHFVGIWGEDEPSLLRQAASAAGSPPLDLGATTTSRAAADDVEREGVPTIQEYVVAARRLILSLLFAPPSRRHTAGSSAASAADANPLVEAADEEEENVVIVCGGTNYYALGLLAASGDNTMSVHEPLDASGGGGEVSEEDEEEVPGASLWEQLRRLDPYEAARWHPKDERRIESALRRCREAKRNGRPVATNSWCLRTWTRSDWSREAVPQEPQGRGMDIVAERAGSTRRGSDDVHHPVVFWVDWSEGEGNKTKSTAAPSLTTLQRRIYDRVFVMAGLPKGTASAATFSADDLSLPWSDLIDKLRGGNVEGNHDGTHRPRGIVEEDVRWLICRMLASGPWRPSATRTDGGAAAAIQAAQGMPAAQREVDPWDAWLSDVCLRGVESGIGFKEIAKAVLPSAVKVVTASLGTAPVGATEESLRQWADRIEREVLRSTSAKIIMDALLQVQQATNRYAQQQRRFLRNRLMPILVPLLQRSSLSSVSAIARGGAWKITASPAPPAPMMVTARVSSSGGEATDNRVPESASDAALLVLRGGPPAAAATASDGNGGVFRWVSQQSIIEAVDMTATAVELRPLGATASDDESVPVATTKSTIVQKTCALCNVTVPEGAPWEGHLSSRRHAASVRNLTRTYPPPKRDRKPPTTGGGLPPSCS